VKKRVANVSASVRQRLLNLATERKEDFGLVVTRYGLERFLYRLSVSTHRDSFVLKGALLLQLWIAETYRPTRDLDLLGRGISNVSYRKIFSEVCSQKVEDDGLTFLPDTIRVERIRDDETYEGVRVRLEARLGNVRVPLQIDVGLGDAIVPASEELRYPTLLRFPAPKLHAYSKESVVAEKFEAMVKLGIANSRMKDFYDLWVLAQGSNSRVPLSPQPSGQHSKRGVRPCRGRLRWRCSPIFMNFQRSRRNGERFCERVGSRQNLPSRKSSN
jgi:predicted nucleotidyltransferase component of viral defense system